MLLFGICISISSITQHHRHQASGLSELLTLRIDWKIPDLLCCLLITEINDVRRMKWIQNKRKKIVTKLVLERWFGGFTSGRKWLTICRSDINQLTPVHYSELLLLMATPQQQPAPQQHYIVACCRDGRTCNAHATNQPIQRTVQSFRVYLPSQINKQNIQKSIIDSIFFSFQFTSQMHNEQMCVSKQRAPSTWCCVTVFVCLVYNRVLCMPFTCGRCSMSLVNMNIDIFAMKLITKFNL